MVGDQLVAHVSKHLTLVEEDDPAEFARRVEYFLNAPRVKLLSVKFQRNLYYSLSGSTHGTGMNAAIEEGGKLRQSHLAFVVWQDVAWPPPLRRWVKEK